jgi:hypothetical protein
VLSRAREKYSFAYLASTSWLLLCGGSPTRPSWAVLGLCPCCRLPPWVGILRCAPEEHRGTVSALTWEAGVAPANSRHWPWVCTGAKTNVLWVQRRSLCCMPHASGNFLLPPAAVYLRKYAHSSAWKGKSVLRKTSNAHLSLSETHFGSSVLFSSFYHRKMMGTVNLQGLQGKPLISILGSHHHCQPLRSQWTGELTLRLLAHTSPQLPQARDCIQTPNFC